MFFTISDTTPTYNFCGSGFFADVQPVVREGHHYKAAWPIMCGAGTRCQYRAGAQLEKALRCCYPFLRNIVDVLPGRWCSVRLFMKARGNDHGEIWDKGVFLVAGKAPPSGEISKIQLGSPPSICRRRALERPVRKRNQNT